MIFLNQCDLKYRRKPKKNGLQRDNKYLKSLYKIKDQKIEVEFNSLQTASNVNFLEIEDQNNFKQKQRANSNSPNRNYINNTVANRSNQAKFLNSKTKKGKLRAIFSKTSSKTEKFVSKFNNSIEKKENNKKKISNGNSSNLVYNQQEDSNKHQKVKILNQVEKFKEDSILL